MMVKINLYYLDLSLSTQYYLKNEIQNCKVPNVTKPSDLEIEYKKNNYRRNTKNSV